MPGWHLVTATMLPAWLVIAALLEFRKIRMPLAHASDMDNRAPGEDARVIFSLVESSNF